MVIICYNRLNLHILINLELITKAYMEIEEKNNRDYTNGEITVFWRPAKCTHVTTCFNELIEVFDPSKRPWINMKGASTKEIIRVVDLCPTGAISWKKNSELNENTHNTEISKKVEEKQENTQTAAELKVMPNGPLVVKGEFILKGPDGQEMKKMKMVSICRCGQSHNMPYCDGMHRKVGFSG